METATKSKMKAIKLIYNDDVAIIDFLADLTDREPIHGLQKFVNYTRRQPVCLLYNCPFDDLFILLLYKAPLDFNEPPNKLTLFAYDDLKGLYSYFNRWINQTANGDGRLRGALGDILNTIGHEIVKLNDKDVQADYLG